MAIDKAEVQKVRQAFDEQDGGWFLEVLHNTMQYFSKVGCRILSSAAYEAEFLGISREEAQELISDIQNRANELGEWAQLYKRFARRKGRNPCAAHCMAIATQFEKTQRALKDQHHNAKAAYRRVFRERYKG